MSEHHVTCIDKPHRHSIHEHITHIGNSQQNWKVTRETAIQWIDAGSHQFYTVDATSGRRAYLGVVREAGKQPYLRAHADGKWNDNLLAQDECGANCKII